MASFLIRNIPLLSLFFLGAKVKTHCCFGVSWFLLTNVRGKGSWRCVESLFHLWPGGTYDDQGGTGDGCPVTNLRWLCLNSRFRKWSGWAGVVHFSIRWPNCTFYIILTQRFTFADGNGAGLLVNSNGMSSMGKHDEVGQNLSDLTCCYRKKKTTLWTGIGICMILVYEVNDLTGSFHLINSGSKCLISLLWELLQNVFWYQTVLVFWNCKATLQRCIHLFWILQWETEEFRICFTPSQISQWLVGDVGSSRLQAYPPKHNHFSRIIKRCPPWS